MTEDEERKLRRAMYSHLLKLLDRIQAPSYGLRHEKNLLEGFSGR